MEPIQEFIAQLPKVELHVHLVGSAPVEIDPARIAAGSLGVRHMPSRNPDEYGFAQM